MTEFSRPVSLSRLGGEPFRQEITASEAERESLARRFDLLRLDHLAASVELMRQPNQMFRLRATLVAEFFQSCVVSFEPVAGTISHAFTLLYGPAEMEPAPESMLDDDIAFEPLAGDIIDIGEAVAQEFSLALPIFPRTEGASVQSEAPQLGDAGFDPGPFGELSRLTERRGGSR